MKTLMTTLVLILLAGSVLAGCIIAPYPDYSYSYGYDRYPYAYPGHPYRHGYYRHWSQTP
jgi:hypothetical protein